VARMRKNWLVLLSIQWSLLMQKSMASTTSALKGKMVSQNLSRSGRFVLMRKEMSSTVEHPHFCLVVSKRYEFLNVVEVFMLTKILVN